MRKRTLCCLLGLVGLLLARCGGGETPASTGVAVPSSGQAAETAGPSSAPDTVVPPATAPAASATEDPLGDLEAIDAVLREIDNQVCQEALETRAEIEALLQQGQDVSDLAAAIDELIAELEECSLIPTPTP